MGLRKVVRSAAAGVLAVSLLCPSAAASARSADVLSAALGEVGYIEGAGEYSKFGAWYGLPNSYWCDMFVSWCGAQAGIPTSKFPHECSCTRHVRRFSTMGRYQKSAARGGSYVPQQGDVIFFYNYLKNPSGSAQGHTGLVLYVSGGEVFTVEGNALTGRMDLAYADVSALEDDDLDPPEYVAVNHYPLDSPRIHGYGIPDYDDRTPLPLTGFVDLGRYAQNGGMYQTLCNTGVMQPTSSHTFSPHDGMTRGEFIKLVTGFFGLNGYTGKTRAFDDVPAGSDIYEAAMAARSAGLVFGAGGNDFHPEQYIAPDAAQAILNRALAYVGLEPQDFAFSEGDLSYIIRPYTIRADIAQAFDTLSGQAPLTEAFEGTIELDGTPLGWPVRRLNGVCYVPVQCLRQLFPELEIVSEGKGPAPEEAAEEPSEANDSEEPAEAGAAAEAANPVGDGTEETAAIQPDGEGPEAAAAGTQTEETDASAEEAGKTGEPADTQAESAERSKAAEPAGSGADGLRGTGGAVSVPAPMGSTARVLPAMVTLRNGEKTICVEGFTFRGGKYAALRPAAEFLSIDVAWSSEGNGGILLTMR